MKNIVFPLIIFFLTACTTNQPTMTPPTPTAGFEAVIESPPDERPYNEATWSSAPQIPLTTLGSGRESWTPENAPADYNWIILTDATKIGLITNGDTPYFAVIHPNSCWTVIAFSPNNREGIKQSDPNGEINPLPSKYDYAIDYRVVTHCGTTITESWALVEGKTGYLEIGFVDLSTKLVARRQAIVGDGYSQELEFTVVDATIVAYQP